MLTEKQKKSIVDQLHSKYYNLSTTQIELGEAFHNGICKVIGSDSIVGSDIMSYVLKYRPNAASHIEERICNKFNRPCHDKATRIYFGNRLKTQTIRFYAWGKNSSDDRGYGLEFSFSEDDKGDVVFGARSLGSIFYDEAIAIYSDSAEDLVSKFADTSPNALLLANKVLDCDWVEDIRTLIGDIIAEFAAAFQDELEKAREYEHECDSKLLAEFNLGSEPPKMERYRFEVVVNKVKLEDSNV